jgi:Holliday junction resolvase RusA-like endonuclease
MLEIPYKPLSVNEAFMGRRFNTKKKTEYEKAVSSHIRNWRLDDVIAPYEIHFRFYIPKAQDYDNCIKCTQDILMEHFNINDKDIYKAVIEKIPVKK